MKNLADAVKNFKKGVEDVAKLADVNPTNVRRALNGEFNSPRVRKSALTFLKTKFAEMQILIATEESSEGKAA